MTFQEIRIIATGPCIANQLRDVNTICRRSWYIAAHVWKIYDFICQWNVLFICSVEVLISQTKGKYKHMCFFTGNPCCMLLITDNTDKLPPTSHIPTGFLSGSALAFLTLYITRGPPQHLH
jgi:hypothetical protein